MPDRDIARRPFPAVAREFVALDERKREALQQLVAEITEEEG